MPADKHRGGRLISFGKIVLAVALGNILSWVLVVGLFMGLWTVGYVQSELRGALQTRDQSVTARDRSVTVRTFDELDYREPDGSESRELDPHLADRGCGDYAVSPQGRGSYAVKCGDSYFMVFTIIEKVMGPYEGGSRAN